MPNFINIIDRVKRELDANGRPTAGALGAPLEDVLGLVIHHEGGPNSPDGSNPFNIAEYHVETLGWDHVGYNLAIHQGRAYLMLGPDRQGYHSGLTGNENVNLFPNKDPRYYNRRYMSLVVVGNYDLRELRVADKKVLIEVCAHFKRAALAAGKKRFDILGMCELPGKQTTCPGKNIVKLLPEIRAGVENMLNTGQPAEISKGDDPFWQQFVYWRDGAIAIKGVADKALQDLRDVKSMWENEQSRRRDFDAAMAKKLKEAGV